MQLFSADSTMLSKFFTIFVAHKKLKKPLSKVAQKNSNPFFSLLPWAAQTAQTAQTEEFMFQNWPTVYRTGISYRDFLNVRWYFKKWTFFT